MDYDKHIPDEELSIYVRELEDRIAELEEANIDLMVASAKHYRCVGQRDARIAELEADLADMTSRYSRAATDIASLEARLAEAREDSARLKDAIFQALSTNTLTGIIKQLRAAIDAAREG